VSEDSFTLPSFAKINWTLRVLGRRSDGFHEIRTIFQTVTLHDRISFNARADDDLHFTCDSQDIPTGESNLILRAANALREFCGIRTQGVGASIHLEKHIPVEAGLGGGSSNAAISLLGLSRLWEIKISRPQLLEIGASLGADVPFFLTGGTALGTGLGTEIAPLDDVIAEHLLIVKPGVSVSTTEAYKALRARALTKVDSDIILSISRAEAQFKDSFPDALHNDFEPVIFRLEPEIERAKKWLLERGARNALLAGSGSSVFGVFDNREEQAGAREALREETNWRVFSCAALTRAQYLASL
jgi:4-diphosphocytidyl-2-C-methyl-D-erythritol kinase